MSDDLTERIAEVLAMEFGSFLAHDPHDPERFYRLAAEQVRAVLGETTTEWGRISRTDWMRGDKSFAMPMHPDAAEKWRERGYTIVTRTSPTPWIEAPA